MHEPSIAHGGSEEPETRILYGSGLTVQMKPGEDSPSSKSTVTASKPGGGVQHHGPPNDQCQAFWGRETTRSG
jgi:hypothetical protein